MGCFLAQDSMAPDQNSAETYGHGIGRPKHWFGEGGEESTKPPTDVNQMHVTCADSGRSPAMELLLNHAQLACWSQR